jgi:CPA2 family monovalent cation:H+ antiporter-2
MSIQSAVIDPELPQLFLEFGLLLLALGLLTRFAHRLGISSVPFYLLGGLAVGKGGVVGIDAEGTFIPTIAELGVVLLLLLLGLEYSGRQILTTAKDQSRSGLIDLVVNFIPGAVAALIFGWGFAGALALGGVTYISSSGIVSQVVRDLRWRRNPETAPVVSILVMEDLVMAPYLPVLTVVLTGAGLATGLIQTGVALAVVAVVLLISIRSESWGTRLFIGTNPTGLLLVVFGAAVAAAGLAGLVSFSPAVAAFLVGLLLTGEVAEAARRRLDPLREVLAAVFFTYFGLSTDPADLPAVLLPAFVLAVITIATKYFTGWYAARTIGATAIGRLRAGALLSSRGEFSIVIAGLAAASTVLPPQFQAFVAAYVLITATAGPLLARFSEPWGWRIQQRHHARNES